MKAALTIAALALAFTGLAGCGGSDSDGGDGAAGAPTDASVDDFCANFKAFGEDLGSLGDDPDPADMLKAIQSAAEKMVDTGTPDDISDDAREGFEVSVDAILGLKDGASQEEILGLDDDFTDAEKTKSDAFDDYLATTCDL